MSVREVTGATPGGVAPVVAPAAAPGAFDATLQQALAAPAPSPTEPITLGQMLRVYGTGLATAAPSSPAALAAATAHAPHAAQAVPPTTTSGGTLGIGALARPLDVPVNSDYGPRTHPVHGDVRQHHGVDMSAPTGTPIRSFADGTVTFAGPRGGYGNVVIVEHANGYETRYAHQSAIDVAVGQRIRAGEVVGRVGSTGQSTGPHLHFELRHHGESMDPAPYL